jgi:NAD(P)-dependent dehydrogenase (short-subunit alcohol dehydrogenase family)
MSETLRRMTTATTPVSATREPALLGQTVVVIGGSAGIGFATAQHARGEGADIVLTGRDAERLERAATKLGARSSAAFDANDTDALMRFFADLPGPIDHVMITAGGPSYVPLLEMDGADVGQALGSHAILGLEVARHAAPKMRPAGTLILMSGVGGGRPKQAPGIASAAFAAIPSFTAALALELAPVRANLIAAGFVDTRLTASLLGDQLEARRQELGRTLPIRRVVQPEDVAALAVHIMVNTALTGATFDIDGGQQYID